MASLTQDETNWQDDECKVRIMDQASDEVMIRRIIADYAGHDPPDGT